MALLEEGKMAEMVDFIGESLREAEAEEANESHLETEEVVESSEASEDVNEEEASPSETEEDVKEEPGDEEDAVEAQDEDSEPEEKPRQKDSKWVPRDRLNEVNDKWREREQQLMVQLGALEERTRHLSQQSQPAAAEDDWMSDFLEEGESAPSKDIEEIKANQARVLQWQDQFTRQMIHNEFNQELQTAMEKYPSIPEQVFRDAVARDGRVNMLELGDRLSGERSALEAKWKAAWDKTHTSGEETSEPDAVRRPSRRSSPSAPAPKEQPKAPSTIRDAGDAMAKEMAEFFESLS